MLSIAGTEHVLGGSHGDNKAHGYVLKNIPVIQSGWALILSTRIDYGLPRSVPETLYASASHSIAVLARIPSEEATVTLWLQGFQNLGYRMSDPVNIEFKISVS